MLSWRRSGFQAWIGDLGCLSPESRQDALERITRYVARAPVALSRMMVTPSGRGKIIYHVELSRDRNGTYLGV